MFLNDVATDYTHRGMVGGTMAPTIPKITRLRGASSVKVPFRVEGTGVFS